MNNLDLRPLSVGEILDRTFTLYRNNFILFLGISAIPHILVLALSLAQVFVLMPAGLPSPGSRPATPIPTASTGGLAAYGILALLGVVVAFVALLLSEGATVIAVSELYLGRAITIGESFRRVRGELGTLFGVMLLHGMAVAVGFILLIIPGVYVMCRLLVDVPSALLENLDARVALERSWRLTEDSAGRAFLIIVLYFSLSMAASMLFAVPFQLGMLFEKNNPGMIVVLLALVQVGSFIATVLVTPVMTIAAAILYYDLRVRKEAFDLQVMMAPLSGTVIGGTPKAFT